MDEQIRWQQRFNHFQDAFSQLERAVELSRERPLTELEQQGLIQAFEFTHELAWKVLKDFLVHQGFSDITGSRDATRAAFSTGLIYDGHGWMAMIQSRNETSHTYNRNTAEEIVTRILQSYYALFVSFVNEMKKREQDQSEWP